MKVTAACHVHSEWSYDAEWSLRDLAAEFGKRGCRVLLITEHDRGFSQLRFEQHRAACAEASSADLLIVPGIEYSDSDNVVHVLTWGVPHFLGECVPTQELLKMVNTENGISVLAHPARRKAWMRYQRSWADQLTGIEVWNRKADGWAPSIIASNLLKETDLVPFASLDFHRRNQMFPLSMELDIEGDITEASVLNCMRARRCCAMAFHTTTEKFLTGWRSPAVYATERMRRTAAPLYRGLKYLTQGR